MQTLCESKRYPYIPIDMEINNFKLKKEAYVDTGATTYGVFLPDKQLERNEINQKFFTVSITTGDGKEHFWKCYMGKIKIDKKEFLTSIVISENAKEIILGRGVLDKLVSIFDGHKKKLILKTY